jgi:hypothetical protein
MYSKSLHMFLKDLSLTLTESGGPFLTGATPTIAGKFYLALKFFSSTPLSSIIHFLA